MLYQHQRLKDHQWTVAPDATGVHSHSAASLTVLMDIRDELKELNAILRCPNSAGIPETPRRISANTAKPRKKRKGAKP